MTAAAAAWIALLPVVGTVDAGPGVTFIAHSGAVALSEAEASHIARRVESLIVGCAITSVTAPKLFVGRSLLEEWQDARSGPHIHVRFPEPIRTRRGGRVAVSEVVVGLRYPTFIGPELSRHGERVVGHVKCDGHRSLALMCATAVRAHLLPRQAVSCDNYEAIGDPPEEE